MVIGGLHSISFPTASNCGAELLCVHEMCSQGMLQDDYQSISAINCARRLCTLLSEINRSSRLLGDSEKAESSPYLAHAFFSLVVETNITSALRLCCFWPLNFEIVQRTMPAEPSYFASPLDFLICTFAVCGGTGMLMTMELAAKLRSYKDLITTSNCKYPRLLWQMQDSMTRKNTLTNNEHGCVNRSCDDGAH